MNFNKNFIIVHIMVFALFEQATNAATMTPFLIKNSDGTFSLVCNTQSYQKQNSDKSNGTPKSIRIDCFTCSTNNHNIDLLLTDNKPNNFIFSWAYQRPNDLIKKITKCPSFRTSIRAPPHIIIA